MSDGEQREVWDVLHREAREDGHYSTGNIGEAIPGVQTPLSWTVWSDTIEATSRTTYQAVGAYTRAEARLPNDPRDRVTQIFYGRPALRLEPIAVLGDRLPGTSGREVVAQVCGEAPESMDFTPTRRRYVFTAIGLPYQIRRVRRRLPDVVGDTASWYDRQTGRVDALDLAATQALFAEAVGRFRTNVSWQMTTLFCVVQPHFDLISRITARVGVGDPVALTSGYGGVAETAVVEDLWRASRGNCNVDAVARRHGFHGPLEGELSSRVWREDDTPLRRLVTEYARRGDEADPRGAHDTHRAIRAAHERELLDAVPAVARPVLRVLFGRLAAVIPLRGMAKNAFLQAFDVVRASARHAGELLTEVGALDEPDDVFYLTSDELISLPRSGIAERVRFRRDRHAEYQQLRIPEAWVGEPQPLRVETATDTREGLRLHLTGVGVSSGVVEGTAHVVTDPTFADVEPGEILVSATTDPSWSPIMFVSAGLVVDIGGVMSHAAVIARDLGIPCVVNARDASRQIRSGDRLRVNGTDGTVEIVEPVT